MTKAPVDPCADIRAMIRERRLADRIVYGRTWLYDVAEGRSSLPLDNRSRMRTLAFALGCEVRYLDKLVAEWTTHQAGEAIKPEPSPPVKQHDRAKLTQKALAADAAKGALPTKVCTGPCRQLLPITEFYQHGGQCKTCRRARATAYREAHPKKRKLPGVVLCGTYWAPPTS